MGNPGITPQGRKIDLLRSAPGAELEKAGKGQQVTDIQDLTDITLYIGGDLVGQPLVGRNVLVIDPRVSALPKEGKKIIRDLGEALQLIKIRGQQGQQAAASGK